jgi:hypothetical protein
MKIFLIVLLTSLMMSFNVKADSIINGDMVKNQVLSVINNKHNTWTATDFAIARGDSISSVSNLQITKDVITKSGIKLPNIINTILMWSK